MRGVDSGTGVAPDPVAVGTILLTLYTASARSPRRTPSAPDPTGTATRKALAILLGDGDVNTAMGDPRWHDDAVGGRPGRLSSSTALGPYMDAATARVQPRRRRRRSHPARPRFEYVLRNLLAYQIKTLSTGLVIQTLAQQLGLREPDRGDAPAGVVPLRDRPRGRS